MSGNRVLEYWIKAKDATAGAISSAIGRMKTFAATVGKNLTNIKSGFEMLAGTARAAFAQMQKAFAFEKMTVQFKTLTGSMDEARAHMQMLQDMGDTPPFSMEQFASASRSMMAMTDGLLGYKDSLTMVGDAAAATGRPIEEVGRAVARAFSFIKDGAQVMSAVEQLRTMGIVAPDVVIKLQDMQKAGASNAEMWQIVEEQIKRFNGAMKDTEQTGDGLMAAIGSQWDDTMRNIGAAFLDVAKDGLGTLLEAMKAINEDGSLEVWAENAASAIADFAEGAKTCLEPIGTFLGWMWKSLKTVAQVPAQAIGGIAGAISGGGGVKDALAAGWEGAKSGFNDVWDTDGAQAAYDAQRKDDRAAKKRDEREAKRQKAEQMALEKQEKIKEELARKQAEKEQREADAAYEEELKKYYEMLDKEEEARRKMEEQLAEEARRAEEKRHEQKMKDAEAEVSALQSDRSEAENRLAAAQQKTEQAWGWYRNKDTMQAKIDDFKEQQAAEKQWAKDFEKLKSRRRDWRDVEFGQLSAADEATRQVALAKEEEQAAQKALEEIVQQETEANENLAAILAELKGGEG